MLQEALARRWVVPLTLFVVFLVLRVGLVERQGLWTDELFSLAMATGHSLEHPADAADAALGDYVELPGAVAPAFYGSYLEHDNPPAGPDRVLRAIRMSETSPPVYSLLLWAWTRALGTSDAALRWFSLLCALACFPVLWFLAKEVGGRSTQLPALTLFSFSPICVYYSTEGRMYSLLLFWTISTVWLALLQSRLRPRAVLFAAWIGVAAAGLLTHYFFSFVFAGLVLWLMFRPGECSRRAWVTATVVVALLVLPWYASIPERMSVWRVTDYWLQLVPFAGYDSLSASLSLPWTFFSVHGPWGGAKRWDWILASIVIVTAVLVLRKTSWAWFSPPRTLLWGWVLAPCVGLVLFDQWRKTYVVAVPRYALAGLPAALLLLGWGLGQLRRRLRWLLLGLIVLLCLVSVRRMYLNSSRALSPYRQVGSLVVEEARANDLILVHSIPSGVAGIARYLEAAGDLPEGVGFASWVGQLGQREVPADLLRLAAGRERIIVVTIHAVGEAATQVEWLQDNAVLTAERRIQTARIYTFVPRAGERF